MICDPPAFVKSRKDLKIGAQGYRKMVRLAAPLVAPGGFLFVASCSHLVDLPLFAEQVRRGLRDAEPHRPHPAQRRRGARPSGASRPAGNGLSEGDDAAARLIGVLGGGNMSLNRLLLAVALVCLVGTGCSIPDRADSVPRADTTRAMPLGIPNARFFADADPKAMVAEGVQSGVREAAALRAEGKLPTTMTPAYFLAISGGGDNGAFGAGLLNGWTALGTRPQFKIVTGVSTGALIAPFAFLGSAYDAQLREVYTTMTPENVYRRAVHHRRRCSTTHGRHRAARRDRSRRYADQKLLDAIAVEYDKGRLLLIGTTNLDAQRPVIWNIGAIAASGHPGALELFRKILRASAAIPGVFQPVMMDVELDGTKYQEMHVDGGAIAQLFLYPPSIDIASLKRPRIAYIIRNGRLDPDYAMSERRTISIAGRAIIAMLAASGTNDVLRTYFVSQRDKVDYNLAYVGADFDAPKKGEFDPAYMNALYEYGVRQMVEGKAWHKQPPGLGTLTGVPVTR